jgi:pyruvate/2-oxoacid:ferredoxin oxidoreductase beta subunit
MLGREDVNVVGFFGDGGTYDIGFQAISGAAERNENVFVVCKDNEAYMNTGNQRSGSTPLYATTMTTPIGPFGQGKETPKKNILMIFAAHHVPYVASASIAYPMDLIAKVNHAKTVQGFKMLIVHSPCPTGWEFDPSKTIEVARLAVQTGIWPLYEITDGERLRMTYKPRELKPVGDYIKAQRRFRHFTDAMRAEIQKRATTNWEKLCRLDEGGELTVPFTP